MRPHIDGTQLRADVQGLAEIGGEPDGGVTRLAYSEEEARARQWMADQYAQLGLQVRVDIAGNLLARREGREDVASVMTGSHVDTVPHGGRFDGAAGSLAALAVARAMQGSEVATRRPIEFVVFAAEESPRFRAGHRFGSRAMAGQVTAQDAVALVDSQGVTLAEAMRRVGLDPQRLTEARRERGALAAFVELHIEQGTRLQRAGVPVGIVTSITGTRRYRIDLTGRADHSGGTPMGQRRDALLAAAEVVLAMERIAIEVGGDLVGTVTMLTVEPNAMNVVPGRAVLGVDLRDLKTESIEAATARLMEALDEIGERREVVASVQCLRDTSPLLLSAQVQEVSEEGANRVGIPTRHVGSLSGHDATSLSALTDVGMIFVRNPSGNSHSPAERVEWDDLTAATQVLLETVLKLAGA